MSRFLAGFDAMQASRAEKARLMEEIAHDVYDHLQEIARRDTEGDLVKKYNEGFRAALFQLNERFPGFLAGIGMKVSFEEVEGGWRRIKIEGVEDL